MENVDFDYWDKMADTPGNESEEPSSHELSKADEPVATPVNSLLYHSCEFPHKDEFNNRVPCPNEATHVIFNLNHSDPENPELHIENSGSAAIATVCREHANEAKMMTDINSMAAAQGLKGAIKGREKVTFHAHPLTDLDSALTAAGVRKGSVEEKEAHGSIVDVLRRNALRSVGGRVSPVTFPGEQERRAATDVDINALGSGSNNIPALASRGDVDQNQFEEVTQPQQLSIYGKYLASEREKKNFQKQIAAHNLGKHTPQSYYQGLKSLEAGQIDQVCPACLMKGEKKLARSLLLKHGLYLGPLGVYAPHPTDTAEEAQNKIKELDKEDAKRKEGGLPPINRSNRLAGRPSILESGDTGEFTVPGRTWDVEQELPWGLTDQNDPRLQDPLYADSNTVTLKGQDDQGNILVSPFLPSMARPEDTEIVDGKVVIKKQDAPFTTSTGRVVTAGSPGIRSVTQTPQFPSRSIAPSGRVSTYYGESAARRNRLDIASSAISAGTLTAFPMAKDYQGTEEFPDLNVKQHPHVDPSVAMPIAWHDGRAVHVMTPQRDSGGTVWLPSEVPAMKHADDCQNTYSFPYRSACRATCRNLTQNEVATATSVRQLQYEGERNTTAEGLETLAGAFEVMRPRLEAQGFMRMLQESAGTDLNPYDKTAVANHLKSLGANINPEDITDTLLKNLINASEPVYKAEDERTEHNRILVDLIKDIDGIDADEMERRLSRVSWGAGTKNYEFQRGKGLPPNPTFIQQMEAAKAKAAEDAAAAKELTKAANKKKKAKKRSISGRVKTRQATVAEHQAALDAATDRKAAREVITRDND